MADAMSNQERYRYREALGELPSQNKPVATTLEAPEATSSLTRQLEAKKLKNTEANQKQLQQLLLNRGKKKLEEEQPISPKTPEVKVDQIVRDPEQDQNERIQEQRQVAPKPQASYSDEELEGMSWQELLALRERTKGQVEQNRVANAEHQRYARDTVEENPAMALPMAAMIPAYQLKKAVFGGARSEGGMDQMKSGYKGIVQGLLAKMNL